MGKKWNKFRYITLANIIWYISGQFIYEFILNYLHYRSGKPPENKYAVIGGCENRYCRECGGTICQDPEEKAVSQSKK